MKFLMVLMMLAAPSVPVMQKGAGSASANGSCNIVISGNHNTVPAASLRACQGLDKEEAKKIVSLLNRILSAQKPSKTLSDLSVKMDELLAAEHTSTATQSGSGNQQAVQGGTGNQQANYQQECGSGPCAQGTNSQAIQNGPAKIRMDVQQQLNLSTNLKLNTGGFKPVNVYIVATTPATEDTDQLAGQLAQTLGQIFNVDYHPNAITMQMCSDPPTYRCRDGIEIDTGEQYDAEAHIIAKALKESGVVKEEPPIYHQRGWPAIRIAITPYH